jgi:hypothetical protein
MGAPDGIALSELAVVSGYHHTDAPERTIAFLSVVIRLGRLVGEPLDLKHRSDDES